MGIFLKKASIAVFIVLMAAILGSCGGSSSSNDSPLEVPINISLKNVTLNAGVPTTITYTVPAPGDPYTEIIIDLAKTLEAAQIVVTPTP